MFSRDAEASGSEQQRSAHSAILHPTENNK
jgi:hypothetical protein